MDMRIVVEDFLSRLSNNLVASGPIYTPQPRRLGWTRINPHTGTALVGAATFAFFNTPPNQQINSPNNNNNTAPISVSSSALDKFIEVRRQATETNEALSQQYSSSEHKLTCPLLQDFPLIPVRFNGRLYDYDRLVLLIENNIITDPITREKITISPHVIQPDYDAQARMDELLAEMKKSHHPHFSMQN